MDWVPGRRRHTWTGGQERADSPGKHTHVLEYDGKGWAIAARPPGSRAQLCASWVAHTGSPPPATRHPARTCNTLPVSGGGHHIGCRPLIHEREKRPRATPSTCRLNTICQHRLAASPQGWEVGAGKAASRRGPPARAATSCVAVRGLDH